MAYTDTERLDWILEHVRQSGGLALERRIGVTGTRNDLDLAMYKDVADDERRKRTKLALFQEKVWNLINSGEYTEAELQAAVAEVDSQRRLNLAPEDTPKIIP